MRSASGRLERLELRLEDRLDERLEPLRLRERLLLLVELARERLRFDAPLLRDRLAVAMGILLRWGSPWRVQMAFRFRVRARSCGRTRQRPECRNASAHLSNALASPRGRARAMHLRRA
jgi:hypothetical protein